MPAAEGTPSPRDPLEVAPGRLIECADGILKGETNRMNTEEYKQARDFLVRLGVLRPSMMLNQPKHKGGLDGLR